MKDCVRVPLRRATWLKANAMKRCLWVLGLILLIPSVIYGWSPTAREQAPLQRLAPQLGPDGFYDRFLHRLPLDGPLPWSEPQLPSAQPCPPAEKCLVLLVLKGPGENDHAIYKGDTATESERMVAEDPMELEQEIAQYVEAELLRHPENQAILIKVAGEVRMGVIERVKRGIGLSAEGMKRQLAIGVLNRMERR